MAETSYSSHIESIVQVLMLLTRTSVPSLKPCTITLLRFDILVLYLP